mgnify:CR=1 FL=1
MNTYIPEDIEIQHLIDKTLINESDNMSYYFEINGNSLWIKMKKRDFPEGVTDDIFVKITDKNDDDLYTCQYDKRINSDTQTEYYLKIMCNYSKKILPSVIIFLFTLIQKKLNNTVQSDWEIITE